MFKIGDRVRLKFNLKHGNKYGNLTLDRDKNFNNELLVIWRNNRGLVKLSNCNYYSEEMLVLSNG